MHHCAQTPKNNDMLAQQVDPIQQNQTHSLQVAKLLNQNENTTSEV